MILIVFFLKKHKYKIIHISKLTVKNSCSISSNSLVDIVSSNKTAEIINRFYKDENIRNKSKNYVYNKVKGKYTYEKIKLQFNNIMDQWNL